MKPKSKLLIILATLACIIFTSCSEDVYETHTHNSNKHRNAISFKQFLIETEIIDFHSIKSINSATENQRIIANEYLVDTVRILRHIDLQDKVTYSFRIYPIVHVPEPDVYYNLVYEKINNIWNEIIFKNKTKPNPQGGAPLLDSSEMIYNNRLAAMSSSTFCEVITISPMCNGSCGSNSCDGYGCPTGECLTLTVNYVFCEPDTGGGEIGFVGIGFGPPPGGGESGTYMPNPYNGAEIFNDATFILFMQTNAFVNSLPQNQLIAQTPLLYQGILDFFNVNGFTQQNKDIVIQALTKIPDVISFPHLPYMTNYEIMSYNQWAFNYLLNNPEVSLEQFKKWFMAVNEGDDFLYNSSYWENPNLNFPQQSLPTYNAYSAAFPRDANGNLISGADNVYPLVGGAVLQARIDYPVETENTCALKVSIALNRAGIIIPFIPGQTLEGGGTEFSGKYFFLNAKALNSWMRKTFGTNPATSGTPYNANHVSYQGYQGGTNGQNFPRLLNGINGIYSMITTQQYDLVENGASGHADYIYPISPSGDADCGYDCFFNLPIERIDVWILN